VSSRGSIWSTVPPLAGSGIFAIGSGVLQTLMPLRLHQLGYSAQEAGLVAAGYAAGFLIGCLFVSRLIASVGHVRACNACCAAAAVMILGFDWAPPLWGMVLLEVAIGIAASGLATVTESWLNELVLPEWRGRLLTLYMIILTLAWGIGQLLALGLDPGSSRMLILTAGCYALALIPVAAVKVESPKPPTRVRPELRRVFGISPSGMASCFYTGLVAATVTSTGPLYGAARGWAQSDIVLLMVALPVGGLILQGPLGHLSDRVDRRRVLFVMALLVALVSGALGVGGAGAPFWLLVGLFALLGGLAECFYPIGVALANDRAAPEDYVSVSSNLLLVWAAGGMVGPLIATAALERGGAEAYFLYPLVLSLVLAAYLLWRLLRRPRIDPALREEFVAYPTTSPEVFEWSPHKPLDPGAS
jgi:MFS family permease